MSHKKILMIIAHKDFRDEEYFIPLDIFRKAGLEVTTASSNAGTAVGVLGGEAEVMLNLKDAEAEAFDAVIFVGGNGAQEYFESPEAHRIAKEAASARKIVGAICIAPVILVKAGVLTGRMATVWSSALDKTGPKALLQGGCAVSDNAVEISGNIITGRDRDAAEEFAKAILGELAK